jgi:hypothetical protein
MIRVLDLAIALAVAAVPIPFGLSRLADDRCLDAGGASCVDRWMRSASSPDAVSRCGRTSRRSDG